MKNIKYLILALSVVMTGCVTGTRNIELATPKHESGKTASGTVYIALVEDKREFEQKPGSPSTPSVKGDLASTPKEKLSTLIGRQRNGYGMAMGDVALLEGNTVEDEVRRLLKSGLESRGYTIVDDKSADNHVSVDIDKFWAWFTPGMWAVSFESQLQCNLEFDSESKKQTFEVEGYGINKGQVASDANWKLAYERAYADFLENLDNILDAAGL